MLNIFLELISKPEKVYKYSISTIKIILAAIPTSQIYSNYFGSYQVLSILDKNFYEDMYNFIISGNVLIVIFIFLSVRFVLFELVSILIGLLTFYIETKFKTSIDSEYIKFILKITKVIEVKKDKYNNDTLTTGSNFDTIYHQIIYSDNFINKIYDFRYSYIFEVFVLFIGFSLVLFLTGFSGNSSLLLLIVILFILLFYFYISLIYFHKSLIYNYDNTLFAFSILKQIEITNTVINDNKIYIKEEVNKIYQQYIVFTVNDTQYIIEHFLGDSLKSVKLNIANNSQIIIIASKKIPKRFENELLKNSNLQIIYFENNEEEMLVEQLEELLFNK